MSQNNIYDETSTAVSIIQFTIRNLNVIPIHCEKTFAHTIDSMYFN